MKKYIINSLPFFAFPAIAEANTHGFIEPSYDSFYQQNHDKNMNLAILYCKSELHMKSPIAKIQFKNGNNVSIVCIEMEKDRNKPIMPALMQLNINGNH